MSISYGVKGIGQIKIKNRSDSSYTLYGTSKVMNRGKVSKYWRITCECAKTTELCELKIQHCYERIPNAYGHHNILAEFIAGQLKK